MLQHIRPILVVFAAYVLASQAQAIPITHELILAPDPNSTTFFGAQPGDGPFVATMVVETGNPGAPAASDVLALDATSIVQFGLTIGTVVWGETGLDFTGATTGLATAGIMTGTTLTSLLISGVTATEFITIDLTGDPHNWSAVSFTGESIFGNNSIPGQGVGDRCTVNCDVSSTIPEPGTLGLLLAGGLLGGGLWRRRRQR